MSQTISENYPPQPSEVQHIVTPFDRAVTWLRQPVYRRVEDLMFQVNDLMLTDGRQPREQVAIGQVEPMFTGLGGVVSYNFMVTEKSEGYIPSVIRARHSVTSTGQRPSNTHTLLFAERDGRSGLSNAIQTGYQNVDSAVSTVRSRLEIPKPMSRSLAHELVYYLLLAKDSL